MGRHSARRHRPSAAWPEPFGRSALPQRRARPRLVSSQGASPRSKKQPAEPARILVVEDDFLVAMQIESALAEAGFSLVGVASSADEAVAMALAERPALAVMDVRLVGKRDGIDAALQLFREQGLRCIFATAHHDQEVRRRAKPASPLGWLQKPYTMASLVQAVRQALRDLDDGRQ